MPGHAAAVMCFVFHVRVDVGGADGIGSATAIIGSRSFLAQPSRIEREGSCKRPLRPWSKALACPYKQYIIRA